MSGGCENGGRCPESPDGGLATGALPPLSALYSAKWTFRRGETSLWRCFRCVRSASPASPASPAIPVVNWESLKFQPEFTATASNIGYGWWSHDIGGHIFGYRDEELEARWYQLGALGVDRTDAGHGRRRR
uniref:TIM-barrel domain-containing protein n=1 Tax=Bifidobacterium callitrichos TaxID=762209 RepID=UPI002158E52A|nr:TIM-barrel domain-containing protein [Bifidobacterium callitrichos]